MKNEKRLASFEGRNCCVFAEICGGLFSDWVKAGQPVSKKERDREMGERCVTDVIISGLNVFRSRISFLISIALSTESCVGV